MVPEGWSISAIGDLANFSSGGTPSKSTSAYWGGDEPWISGKDLKQHYLTSSIDKLTRDGFTAAKKTPADTVLILVRGMALLKDIPIGYATRELAFNQDIKALTPNNKVDGLYFSFVLVGNRHQLMGLVSLAGHGTGRLDTESLKAFVVRIPPLPEQRKIAKILQTWDRAIATTEKLINASKQQKKALMQQLLTGKKRFAGFGGEWEEKSIEEFFDVGSSKRVLQKDWQTTGIPFYRTRELVSRSKNEPFRSEIFISKELFIELSEKYGAPKPGDFLISGVGTLGISYQIRNGDEFYFKDGNVLWFKLKQGLCSDFFQQCFNSEFVQKQIIEQASITTVGTYTIQNAKKTKFFCPPTIGEQEKCASVLSKKDREISNLQRQLAHLKQEKKALMQQLLTGKRRVKVDAL